MKRSVVIVDDSEFSVKQLTSFFENKLEFKVVGTGKDGFSAISLYEKYKPDLLTLDIVMPNMDGLETVKKIVGKHPDANILMISAVHGDQMLDCMTNGAKNYVEKPLRFTNNDYIEDFKSTINEIFESR